MMLFTEDASYYAEQIKEGKLSVKEVVTAALENMTALNPTLNAVVWRQDADALAKADEYDALLAKMSPQEKADLPPFFGVPTLIKDLGQSQAGQLAASGSILLKDNMATVTDNFVQAVEKAGFIAVGRSNVPEFGFKGISDSKAFGAVNSPIDTNRNPGGSSGGAAAALKSGMVPLTYASDGGGSIRMPASYSGLIGLKPSRGRMPVGPGQYRSWQGAAVPFALTKSVRDTWTLLKALQVTQYEAPFPMPTIEEDQLVDLDRPLRIGYLTDLNDQLTISEVGQAVLDQLIDQLKALGHDVFQVADPVDRIQVMKSYFKMNSVETTVMMEGIAQALGRELTDADMEPLTWAIYRSGYKISAVELSQMIGDWDQWAAIYEAAFKNYDLLLTPTTNGPAPKHGIFEPDEKILAAEKSIDQLSQDDQQQLIWDHFGQSIPYSPYVSIVNLIGQPAISLPMFKNEEGLPIGAQFIASKGNEYLLLQLAKQIEAADLLDTDIVNLEENLPQFRK